MATDPIRVLLIEDDPDDVLLLRESLAEVNAVRIKLAHADRLSNGLIQLARQAYDVILLDLNLPDSRGLETLATIIREFPKTPIVVLSGLADDFTVLEAVRQGAQDYLVKGEISGPMLARVLRYAIERKQTEEILRAERDFSTQVMDSLGQGLTVTNTEGCFEYVNPAYARMIGRTPEELLGQRPHDFTLIDDLPELERAHTRRLNAESSTYETRLRHADGHEAPVLITGVPRLRDGKVAGAIAVITDITERKRAEEVLRHSRDLLDLTGQMARVGGWELALKTQTLSWTEEVYRIHEVDPASRLDVAEAINFYAPEARPVIAAAVQAGINSATPWDLELPLITARGRRIWVRTQGAAERKDGRTVRLHGAFQDITERKRAEEAVREADQRAIRDYERLLERLSHLAQAVGTARDLTVVYRSLREFAVASVPCDGLFVSLYDPQRQQRTCVYSGGDGEEDDVSTLPPLPMTDSPQSRAIVTGQVVVTDDFQTAVAGKPVVNLGIEQDPRLPQSSLAVPMIVLGRVIGGFEVQSVERAAYKPEHVAAMRMAADLAAIATENVQMLERERELRLGAEMSEEALRAERNFSTQVMDSLGQGLTVTNTEGYFEYVNPAYARMIGRTPGELLGRSPDDYVVVADLPELERAHTRRLNAESSSYEIRLRHADGHEMPALITGVPRLRDGKVAGAIAVITDITERKRAEEVLRRRDRILGALAYSGEQLLISTAWEEHLPDVLSRLGKAIEASRVYIFENHSGADGELLTSQRYEWVAAGIMPQIDNPDLQNFHLVSNGFSRWIEILEQGETIHGNVREFPAVERDVLSAQDIRSIMTVPIFVEHKWWGFIGFDECLAEREWFTSEIGALKTAASTLGAAILRAQIEAALRANEAKYHRLVENVQDIIYAGSLGKNQMSSTITYMSRQVETILGYTPDEFLSDPAIWSSSIHPEDAAWVREETQKAFVDGQPHRRFYRAKNKITGEYRWLEDDFLPQMDERGQAVGFFGVVRDITVRKQAEEEIRRHLNRLTALREIDNAIIGSTDMQPTLNTILAHTTAQLGVDAANILLLDPNKQVLEYHAGRGFRTEAMQHNRLPLGDSYAGRAALGRQIVHVADLQAHKSDFVRSPAFSQEGFVCYYGVPLIAKGEVQGMLELFHRTALNPDKKWWDFLGTLAGQAAIAIDNRQLFDGLKRSNLELVQAYDATIEGWSQAMDLRDNVTQGHTLRVTEFTVRLARAMGMSEDELVHIRRGALLHDMGKLGVPDGILLKPGSLTDEEWVIMKQHVQAGYNMLSPIAYLRPALDIPYCHHEKWDGTGYPRGLRGKEIPLPARIFAVVDVWDAITSDRPYRAAWPREKALDYIRQQTGVHFDPEVVNVFMRFILSDEHKDGLTV